MKRKKFIIYVVLFVLVIVGALVLYNVLSENYTPDEVTQTKSEEQKEKQKAPDFEVIAENGDAARLSDYLGTPVVINFWATWCGPCKQELPAFDDMYEKYKDRARFMMVNLTDNSRETVDGVKEFVAAQGYTFPVYYDTQQIAAYFYNITSIPLTVFVDEKGCIDSYQLGAMDETRLESRIKRLIGE